MLVLTSLVCKTNLGGGQTWGVVRFLSQRFVKSQKTVKSNNFFNGQGFLSFTKTSCTRFPGVVRSFSSPPVSPVTPISPISPSLDRYFTKSHEYVVVEKGNPDGDLEDPESVLRVGITQYARKQLGEVIFVDLPEVGKVLHQGECAMQVESIKAVGEVYSPITGKVIEVNEPLKEDCKLLNDDPEGEGWMVKLHPLITKQFQQPTSTTADPTTYRARLGLLTWEEYQAGWEEVP